VDTNGNPADGRRRPAVMLALVIGGPLIAGVAWAAMFAWHADPSRAGEWPLAARRAVGIGCLALSVLAPASVGLLSRETWPVRILLALLFGTGGLLFTFCAGLATVAATHDTISD